MLQRLRPQLYRVLQDRGLADVACYDVDKLYVLDEEAGVAYVLREFHGVILRISLIR